MIGARIAAAMLGLTPAEAAAGAQPRERRAARPSDIVVTEMSHR
jgi:hypothetical protein